MSEAAAEALLALSAEAFSALTQEHFAAARAAGLRAAQVLPGLMPRPGAAASRTGIAFELRVTRRAVHILATASADDGAPLAALSAASGAALALQALSEDSGAVIEGLRLTAGAPRAQTAAQRRSAATRAVVSSRGQRHQPQTLMGEVTAPPVSADARRDAFRAFMTRNRLRPTLWAKEAGVPAGEILGFLTGRSRGFSGAVAEKLARAARVMPEDMFR